MIKCLHFLLEMYDLDPKQKNKKTKISNEELHFSIKHACSQHQILRFSLIITEEREPVPFTNIAFTLNESHDLTKGTSRVTLFRPSNNYYFLNYSCCQICVHSSSLSRRRVSFTQAVPAVAVECC